MKDKKIVFEIFNDGNSMKCSVEPKEADPISNQDFLNVVEYIVTLLFMHTDDKDLLVAAKMLGKSLEHGLLAAKKIHEQTSKNVN